jgi:flagellar hook-associated protein 1 FlgK
MRSTFYGLNIGNKGLFVAQRQLDSTGHNIANANTVGYSRQRFVTSAVPPPGFQQKFAPISKGQVGAGVETLSLDQIRDQFLDRQYRHEQTKANYWSTKSNALYYIEDVFNGEHETSLVGIMGSFFNAVQELTKNPTDEAIRTNMIQEARKMIDVMHSNYSQLRDLMYQQDYALAMQVNTINEISQKIASLNENIFKYEQGGNVANDLRDTRNLLIDQLSTLVDIQYREVGTGKYNIHGLELSTMEINIGVDNEPLIVHKDFRRLYADQSAKNDVIFDIEYSLGADLPDESLLHHIRFEDSDVFGGGDTMLEVSGGSIKGYIDIRDGNDRDNQGIPYFIARLNELAKALVETFNEVHEQGWTVPYTNKDGIFFESATGISFFAEDCLTAATIRLSDEVLASGFNIAASSQVVQRVRNPDDGMDGPDGVWHFNTGNNEIALRLLTEVKGRNDIPVIGSFEGYYKSFISELAAEVGNAKQMDLAEQVLVDSLESQRLSVMGVSIDEEMTHLIRFQHAYNAAARTITSMDDLLDVLINRTGRAGL